MRFAGLHACCGGVVVVQPVLEVRDDGILAQRLAVACARYTLLACLLYKPTAAFAVNPAPG